MAGSDVQITLGADASAAVQGLAQFNASLSGLAPQVANLASAFAGLTTKVSGLASSVSGLAKDLKAAGAQGGDGLAALQKEGGGAASAVTSLTGNVTTLLKGAGDLGRGLKSAGVEGGGALMAVGDEAGPVAAAVGAVVLIALSAADAMAEWARNTAASSTASDDARQKAQALNAAFGQAQAAFKSAGDAIAISLAPAFTVLVGEAAHLAQGFADAYNKSGLLKIGLDALVGGLNATFIPVLGLAEAVELTWIRISGSWDELGQKWQLVQELFSTGVSGIKAAFASLAVAIAAALAGNWVGAAKSAVAGVGEAAAAAATHTAAIRQDMAAISDHESAVDQRLGASVSRFGNQIRQLLGLLKAAPDGSAPTAANGAPATPPASGDPPRSAPAMAKTGSAGPCDCDPAAAAACEADTQAQRTASAAQGLAQRTSDHADASAQVAQNDSGVTAAFASNQTRQVSAAQGADRAKVDSNAAANQKIAAADDKTLKQLESSLKGLVNTFARGLAEMAEGTRSFGQVIRKVGQQILDDIFRVIVGMVEKWAWGVAENLLASQTGQALLQALGLKDLALQIANDVSKRTSAVSGAAAQQAAASTAKAAGLAQDTATSIAERALNAQNAFSGAIAAISPIPFIGPFIAPGIAAEMAALASAAGGYDIPAGVNPLTQLHAQEMVLPARLANPMRDMLAGYGSGATSGVASGGHTFSFGDTHIHGAPNMSPSDFKQALAEHRGSVAEAVAGALRSGWRPSYRQPVGAL